MSDVDSASNREIQQDTLRTANANAAPWRQVFKRAVEQSSWVPNLRAQIMELSKGRPEVSMQFIRKRKFLVVTLSLFLLLGFLIVFGLIRYATSPSAVKRAPAAVNRGKSLLGFASSAKPKPAPGKPYVPVTPYQAAPTVWTQTSAAQPSATAVVPQAPQATLTAPSIAPLPGPPPSPLVSSRTPFTPLVYQARHDKHFGGSCSGQLTLDAAGLRFHCPDDPEGSVQVALNQIGAIDENGIQLLSGKKYHFSIPGLTKNAEQQLFANWLHQVR